MTEQPITPPPELVHEWEANWLHSCEPGMGDIRYFVATRAAQWGADQELEACCELVSQWCGRWPDGTRPKDVLRATRRPNPPSLKQQALEELEQLRGDANSMGMGFDAPTIRRALDLLPD